MTEHQGDGAPRVETWPIAGRPRAVRIHPLSAPRVPAAAVLIGGFGFVEVLPDGAEAGPPPDAPTRR